MSNSRLEVLGSSSAFSINKLSSDDSASKPQKAKSNDPYYYEESYSNGSQDSSLVYKRNGG